MRPNFQGSYNPLKPETVLSEYKSNTLAYSTAQHSIAHFQLGMLTLASAQLDSLHTITKSFRF